RDRRIPTTDKLGLIAGAGRFPFMVLEGARHAGCHVTVIGLKGLADGALADDANIFRWAGLARLGRWIRILKRAGARKVILAGSVEKTAMYGRWRWLRTLPDLTAARIWFFKLPDKRNDTVLSAVADAFAEQGIIMQDCTEYTKEHLAPEGVLTRRQPSADQVRDADFGWTIAKEMGRLDIGQSIAVKETEVIAVEAIEGTDRMIERAGSLCSRGGWTLVKVAKPNQDFRFDVPTVGPETIAKLKQNGGKALVIEAGKTVIVDRERLIADADAAGIVVTGKAARYTKTQDVRA
ncbi:MAG: UDP-2,3-diacylglucosamine diphosphatase LpxI, partial [Planctomycetes bacterium]|nr:UDP-2,3-diacylglucosamine diphosphatase LpxI [Planctomycetota bacterium]